MSLSTSKMVDLPFPFRHTPFPSRLRHPFRVLFSSTSPTNPNLNPKSHRYPWDEDATTRPPPSPPWLQRWTPDGGQSPALAAEKREKVGTLEKPAGGKGQNSIERIVHRLRNLGLEGNDVKGRDFEDFESDAEVKLGDLLERSWNRPDSSGLLDEEEGLPWEREDDVEEVESEVEGEVGGKRRVRAPTLAELTIEDSELRRLRRLGIGLRERLTVPKAGVTQVMVEKIREVWRKSELVRLKFHETLAHDMKTAHELVERRTGGLVIWRAGSVMVVYRGSAFNNSMRTQPVSGDIPSTGVLHEGDELFVPEVAGVTSATTEISNSTVDLSQECQPSTSSSQPDTTLTEEEAEFDRLLDGLGPRFVDWWGTGILPVDADLLPQNIPGYKTPFRLLPTGMRSRLTNAELTNLRQMARKLPCHFALGRNRNHHGLAAAILNLWEKSLVVKIAVKRGVQNTNNKLMADELKKLTGGILLLRNKYYIVMYRGKDFLPTNVAVALAERQELTKGIQDVEEEARICMNEVQHAKDSSEHSMTIQKLTKNTQVIEGEMHHKQNEDHAMKSYGQPAAGTLAEFLEAQARWGREITTEEREEMKKEASQSVVARLVKRIEHKLSLAEEKKLRAEKLLAKIEASMVPAGPSDDREMITDEERTVFRRIGLRMKAYLPLGIRGVFDGVVENMHLHWKHRELVKLISKQKTLSFVEDTARLLEYESGGILVAIERVPKGYTLIYYRGKNYQRPISIRPRNLLTKAKALKRYVAMQRHEALTQHICELEKTIDQYRSELGNSIDLGRARQDDANFDSFSETEDDESYSDVHDSSDIGEEDDASFQSSDSDDFEDGFGDARH